MAAPNGAAAGDTYKTAKGGEKAVQPPAAKPPAAHRSPQVDAEDDWG